MKRAWLSFLSILVAALIFSNVLAQDRPQSDAPKSETEAHVKVQAGVAARVARIATYRAVLTELDNEELLSTGHRPSVGRARLSSGVGSASVSHFWSPLQTYTPPITSMPITWNPHLPFSMPSAYDISSQIRLRELEVGLRMSNDHLIPRLPNMPDAWINAGHALTTAGLGWSYEMKGHTFNDLASAYRGARGLGPTDIALRNTAMGSAIFDTANQFTSGAMTFMETVQRMGTSMQIMNPPVYLNERIPQWGWIGEGSYSIKGGFVSYLETLKTVGPGSITRTHLDWATTGTGTYHHYEIIRTPATNAFERFVLNNFPVGSYWDPMTSTSRTITITHTRIGWEGWGSPMGLPSGLHHSPWPISSPQFPTVNIPSQYYDALMLGNRWQTPSFPAASGLPIRWICWDSIFATHLFC